MFKECPGKRNRKILLKTKFPPRIYVLKYVKSSKSDLSWYVFIFSITLWNFFGIYTIHPQSTVWFLYQGNSLTFVDLHDILDITELQRRGRDQWFPGDGDGAAGAGGGSLGDGAALHPDCAGGHVNLHTLKLHRNTHESTCKLGRLDKNCSLYYCRFPGLITIV